MTSPLLTIGKAASLLGISKKALRHYQQLALIPAPTRTDRGYRLFTPADLLRVVRIRKLQDLGMSLDRIRTLLDSAPEHGPLREELRTLLDATEKELARLEERRRRIVELLAEGPLAAIEHPSLDAPLERARVQLASQHPDVAVSYEASELDRRMLGNIDGVQWPAGMKHTTERAVEALMNEPAIYAQLAAITERVTTLENEAGADALVDELLASAAGDFLRQQNAGKIAGPMQQFASEMMQSGASPAQQRFFSQLRMRLRKA